MLLWPPCYRIEAAPGGKQIAIVRTTGKRRRCKRMGAQHMQVVLSTCNYLNTFIYVYLSHVFLSYVYINTPRERMIQWGEDQRDYLRKSFLDIISDFIYCCYLLPPNSFEKFMKDGLSEASQSICCASAPATCLQIVQ